SMSIVTSPSVKSEPAPALSQAEVPPPVVFGKGKVRPLFERAIVQRAVVECFRKLDPRHQLRNPVMFVVLVGSAFTLPLMFVALAGGLPESPGFILTISLWLWFTVLFANFAEAMAEGRGKAQADAMRGARKDVSAKRLQSASRDAAVTLVSASTLRKGD